MKDICLIIKQENIHKGIIKDASSLKEIQSKLIIGKLTTNEPINVFEKFDNKQDFYKKYFYEDVEVQGLIEPIKEYKDRQKINVSDLLFKNTKTLVEPICDFIQSKIDMDKASYIHDKWKKMNTKLLDDY